MRRGAPRGAIIEDAGGVDTFETARAVAGVLGREGRVLVVTQWFHVPRTVWSMRRVGFGSVSAVWPQFVEWRDFYSFAREVVALPGYVVRYWGAGVVRERVRARPD